ncbi:unnamed protein product [Amaranthus hypochondriacus]
MYTPQQPKWIQHLKHPKNPLKEVYKNSKFECKICKTKGKGMRFQCEQCDYNIHSICGDCPDTISSFTHPQHHLQLMGAPNLDHKCHICEKYVRGMVYRCKACSFFMHPICSDFPEVLGNQIMHPPHVLKLQLMGSSKCDVCDKSCKQWRYYCGVCDVHIHVGCLSGKKNDDDDDGGGGGGFDEVLAHGFGEGLGESIVSLFSS